MADSNSATIDRVDRVLAKSGNSRSVLYENIARGLWTPPIKIGVRAVGWPSYEIESLNRARIAGKSGNEIRALVAELVEARKRLA